jgi:hypothetical protein
MEWMNGNNLLQALRDEAYPFSDARKLDFCVQIATVHADVAARNCLVNFQ